MTASFACTGEQSRGGGGFEATACSLLWYRGRAEARFDLYKLEMPAADWTPGAHTYGGARIGAFYYGLVDADDDGLFESYSDAASATSGDFTLAAVNGLDEGDDFAFQDTTAQSYQGLGDLVVAVGGTGGMTGAWSTPDIAEGEAPTLATGSVSIAYAGSSLTLGSFSFAQGAFGYCWDGPSSAATALWRPDRFAP